MAKLTIFEGCDGSGKTTAAKAYAEKTGALYTHLGSFPGELEIAKLYIDAMQPAFTNRRDVVMDRCWISEPIYGAVYRGGLNRISHRERDLLEVFARICSCSIVHCHTDLFRVKASFAARKGEEMLDNTEQLAAVWFSYTPGRLGVETLTPIVYDYATDVWDEFAPYVEVIRSLGAW